MNEANPRTIDGIILTKFDTVDEKVGTAINMVHSTGKPIVFAGVGQKYPHLRKLNVPTVVNALMNWVREWIKYSWRKIPEKFQEQRRNF